MITITIVRKYKEEYEGKCYEKLSDTGGDDGGAKYGYVPCDKEKDVSIVLLQQDVNDDELDLKKVIAAINDL